jgi:nucleotide-binding universal stress UspA family protein
MHVLVPVDSSNPSEDAIEFAAKTYRDADITAIHVINPPEAISFAPDASGSLKDAIERHRKTANTLFEDLEEITAEYGVEFETDVAVGKTSRKILEYAEENDVDQIVIGSHGRTGWERITLGSVAENVVRRASVPVTVVR